MLGAAAGLLAAGCAAPASDHAAAPASQHSTTRPAARPSPSTPAATATPTPGPTVIPVPPPPGNLPQTSASPSAGTPVFTAEMADLWAAVVTGNADLAAQAFFPLPAYTQIKAIYDPAADWHGRLFADFQLDVAAAHRFLGPAASQATLVRVIVPAADAGWIPPGCAPTPGVTGMWAAPAWSTRCTASCARSGSPR